MSRGKTEKGEYVLHPNIIWDGKRSFLPEDLDDDEVSFLKQILSKIQPTLLRAKTAESLWAKTKRREYAYEAEMAYLGLIGALYETRENLESEVNHDHG